MRSGVIRRQISSIAGFSRNGSLDAACSNQVRKVHVDAVGDDPDLDAGAAAICCAASTFITSLASGSTSGTIGLLGQTCCAAESASMRPWRWREPDAAAVPLAPNPTSATSTNSPRTHRIGLSACPAAVTGWSRPNAKTAWESPRTLRRCQPRVGAGRECDRYQRPRCTTSSNGRRLSRSSGRSGPSAG